MCELHNNTTCNPAWFRSVFTPSVSDGCNSFGIVILCVCVSVSLSRPNEQTYRLEFWHVGQVEGYLSQVWRSRSKVKGQGHQVKNRFSMRCIIVIQQKPGNRWSRPGSTDADEGDFLCGMSDIQYHTWNGRATTLGVFKAYVVFFYFSISVVIKLVAINKHWI